MTLKFYQNGSVGGQNGTLISDDATYSAPVRISGVTPVYVRSNDGNLYASVTITAPTNFQVSTNGTTWATSITLATVGDTNTIHYLRKSTVFAADTPAQVGWQFVSYEAVNHAPDAFTPTVGSITASRATVSYTVTDTDGDALTYKVAVITAATAPSDWSGYTATSAVTYTKGALSASTAYYAHVQASDGEDATVGTSAQFVTLAAAANAAPAAFTPTVRFDNGDASNSRVTVLAQTTDPQGGTLTYRYAVTTSATPPSDWSAYSGNESTATSGNATNLVVTGLTLPGSYYAHVRCTDAQGNSTIGTSKLFFADNFNRANDATGLGAAWTNRVDGSHLMTISSNTARKASFDRLYGIAGLGTETDGAVQFTVPNGATSAPCLFLRATDLNNHYRVDITTSTNVQVVKVVGGTSTVLKNITIPTFSNTNALAADIIGNKIRVYTGSQAGSGLTRRDADDITDSSIASGYFGIGAWNGGDATCDNFDYRRL